MIDIIVDNYIRLNSEDLPKIVLEEIYNKLRISNPRKKVAKREMLWGAESLPEFIELWNCDINNNLLLPRGLLEDLYKIFEDNKINAIWNNSKSTLNDPGRFDYVDGIQLRDYQWRAFHELNIQTQGIYKAPTGSGKTRTMLEVIRQAGQKTLVICEKRDIAQQWYRNSNEFGFDAGLASGRNFDDNKDLTIAMRQTIWAKLNDLDQGWFKQWGMIVVDECHHCTADTMIDLVQRFPAYYRFGCSATPDADPDLFPIAQAVLGPIVHESVPEEIGEHLVIPSVRVVKTDFEFPYRPTCVGEKGKVIRNNYNDLAKSLEEDYARNLCILKYVLQEARNGHNCVIISGRINHLTLLFNIYDNYRSWYIMTCFLTGENSNEYENIKFSLENKDNGSYFDEPYKGSILFTTLADEGTDIPCLDRLFLVYPGRKLRGFEQPIGRIMRPYPRKKDAIVYDFRDHKVSILNSQFRNRCQNIYHKKNYKVDIL